MTASQLREVPLFATLSVEESEALLKIAEKEQYPAHTTIFWMDETGNKLYVVEKGEVTISYSNKSGKEITFAKLGDGSFFGELSLLDGGPHTGTVRTTKPTSVITIDRVSFYSFLEKYPQFSRTLLAVLVDRLRNTTNYMRENKTLQLTELRQPFSFQRFVDRAAWFVTSRRFLAVAIVFLAVWIAGQLIFHLKNNGSVSFIDTPPTFFFLGFVLTLTSFLLTILVLTSQRGLAEYDRARAEIEYQVNLKAQAEVMRLHLKVDELMKRLEEKNNP